MSGIAGNKGAVAIRMEYANTSIVLVTAHLAAGFANFEERNRDYKTISHGLRFQRNRAIEDHDTVIWLGDFNYRIGLRNEHVQKLCQVGDLETLYENDQVRCIPHEIGAQYLLLQLNIQMVAGFAFPFYSEARITFMPTYKYDLGTDTYDTSEKARIPAWCDRVLRKGDNIRQINYSDAPLKFSDHRPVYATFQCLISKVDEKKKDQLSEEIYRSRKEIVGDTRATGGADETDDEDLIGYESVEPGLPPASSDRRKWWLDNGLPARSRVQAPSNNHIPNQNRPSNPFTPSSEPDWIKVERIAEKPAPPPARGTRAQTVDLDGASMSSSFSSSTANLTQNKPNPMARKLIVPAYDGAREIPNQPLSRTTSSTSTYSLPSISNVPTRSKATPPSATWTTGPSNLSKEIARKAAPPIPNKKPSILSNTTISPRSTPSPPPQRYKDDPDPTPANSKPQPPPPRRSMAPAARKPVQAPGLIDTTEEERPPLPPRTGTGMSSASAGSGGRRGGGNILDEEPEDLDALRGWEVLRPDR
jgi:endonuclease/exonuclease/phosphatase family metal-dependent hydrolase